MIVTFVYAVVVHRQCETTANNTGVWSTPVLDDCISAPEVDLKQQVRQLHAVL